MMRAMTAERADALDIIGDIHGCLDELVRLLGRLGYERTRGGGFQHPNMRRLVFVGDLVDRGPDSPGVLALVMHLVNAHGAFCVLGNHDDKLVRYLMGNPVRMTHGMQQTVDQLEGKDQTFRNKVAEFLRSCPTQISFQHLDLAVAHAGLRESMIGETSRRARMFALYGESTGERDVFGFPIRHPWAELYRGTQAIVYGHTPTHAPNWVNNTICIDTGCVFGGSLTAVRFPERQLVSVAATRLHYTATRTMPGFQLSAL